jgi:hypothetical protein
VTTRNIHIIGIDPGGTTGWCRLTVPRDSIFGDQYPEIVEWDYGEFTGCEEQQSVDIARLARYTQSLDYKIGPALLVEDWDIPPHATSTDPETLSPVRIGAHLRLLYHLTHLSDSVKVEWLGDATLTFQSRTIKSNTGVSEERLRRLGLWVKGSRHIQDGTKHAVNGLRRARENLAFAKKLWPR